MRQKLDLKNENIKKLFLSYFIPSLISMLVLSTYVIIDGIFVGQGIGSIGLAAVSICLPIFAFFTGIELLFGIGGSALSGIALGSNKAHKARVIFCSIVYFAITFSLLLSISLFIFKEQLAKLLGANDLLMEYVMPYLSVIVLGGVIILMQSILCSFARNDKALNLVMISFLGGSLINIILNYIFIFIFEWGMFGASLSTIIGHFFGLIVISWHFLFKKGDLYFIKAFSIKSTIASIKSGIAPSMAEFAFGFITILMNIFILRESPEEGVAIFGIMMYIGAICFSIILSISHGLQPVVSYNFGSKQISRVLETFKLSIIVSFIVGLTIYILLYFLIPYIGKIFLKDNTNILNDLTLAVRIYFIGYLFLGADVVIGAFLQAIGRIRSSIIVSISHNLLFMLIFLPIFANLFGIIGIWSSFPTSLLCAFIVSLIIIRYEVKRLWSKI